MRHKQITPHPIDLQGLYYGFINSYNSFLFPSEGKGNRSQETHCIIEYFRKLGISLGFYPCCEANRHDLDWFWSYKNENNEKYKDKLILHLESENSYNKVDETIEKLCDSFDKYSKSSAKYRIGIVWTNEEAIEIEEKIKLLEERSKSDSFEALFIVKFASEDYEKLKFEYIGNVEIYTVRAWYINGKAQKLDKALLLWPLSGSESQIQIMIWPQKKS